MAPPKNVRADGTYMIVADNNDNPKLGAKILSDGRESLFLDYYLGYQINDDGKLKLRRRRETLKLYLWQAPRDPSERAHNKSVLELAKKIRFERSQNLIAQSQGYRLKKDEVDDILAWMDDYAEKYTKADVRIIKGAIQHFKSYLSEVPGFSAESALNPASLTPELVRGYAEWLKAHFNGEGPASTLARFRKILRQAYKDEIFHRDPGQGIRIHVDTGALRKDILSADEITRLIATHYHGENPEIRRAFIFCLYTGLRFVDVRSITWRSIDFANGVIRLTQSKTGGEVAIPMAESLRNIIGQPDKDTPRTASVFRLPSSTMCLKALRNWTKNAGIDKHITWHCARHSFAVNILNNGANIKTVSSLLGHRSLIMTEKYTRAIDSLKQAAINSLPEIKL